MPHDAQWPINQHKQRCLYVDQGASTAHDVTGSVVLAYWRLSVYEPRVIRDIPSVERELGEINYLDALGPSNKIVRDMCHVFHRDNHNGINNMVEG